MSIQSSFEFVLTRNDHFEFAIKHLLGENMKCTLNNILTSKVLIMLTIIMGSSVHFKQCKE